MTTALVERSDHVRLEPCVYLERTEYESTGDAGRSGD